MSTALSSGATILLGLVLISPFSVCGLEINSITVAGDLVWTNASTNAVCTLESSPSPAGPWQSELNVFSTNSTGQGKLALSGYNRYFRLLEVDISGSPSGFSNLVASYGLLHTVAGQGTFGTDGLNNWQAAFEGGPAVNADLSRPHMAMADRAGNIYIADKDSHSILKVTTDGNIHTAAGTHEAGDNGNGPALATTLQLDAPNGLWVAGDDTVYILDTDNGKVRRLATNGVMSTLFKVSGGINVGRGLWAKDDASLVYFTSGTDLRKWTPSGGVKTVNNTFIDLGNLVVDASGHVVVTDRGASRVYRIQDNGDKVVIAGNGKTSGGGDGALATETALAGVRGVWFLPNGGYLLGTHEGSQIWYVDTTGLIHLFVNGLPGNIHSGDEGYFHSPGFKVTEVRSVTLDHQGNVLITENDKGYIRKIDFMRLQP